MLRLNTYDYIGSYSKLKDTCTSQAMYTRLSGVKVKGSKDDSLKIARYGLVADAIEQISIHTAIILVTPATRKSTNVRYSIALKRTYLRTILGFDRVNPIKRIWSVERCTSNLDSITPVNWYTMINTMLIYSDHTLVSCNNNTNWMTLTDVNARRANVPIVDNIPLSKCALVGLTDTLYSEIASLIDIRYLTSSDEQYKDLYINNI